MIGKAFPFNIPYMTAFFQAYVCFIRKLYPPCLLSFAYFYQSFNTILNLHTFKSKYSSAFLHQNWIMYIVRKFWKYTIYIEIIHFVGMTINRKKELHRRSNMIFLQKYCFGLNFLFHGEDKGRQPDSTLEEKCEALYQIEGHAD